MAYESFYGGRQGASFVIVKNYPYIYPPEDPSVEDLSMVTEFKKGGASVDQVNYGEYVLIDTISKNDPDNGKVYRRQMDLDNGLAGAEYIGQICGPEGKIKPIKVGNYDESAEHGEQAPNNIVPGYDGENYNDSIKYSYQSLVNEHGDIIEYKIGFQFPYAVIDFIGESVSPYIEEDLVQREDDGSHPFYEKWKIQIPKGIKGNSIEKVLLFPTIVKAGSYLYNAVDENTGILLNKDPDPIENNLEVVVDKYWITVDKNYIQQLISDNVYKYAKISDCAGYHVGCLIIDYSDEESRSIWYDAGPYRTIEDIQIQTDGLQNNVMTEGYGDQKVHVTYGDLTEEAIGKPLNYILKTAITTPNNRNIPVNHLLVFYSDPKRRQAQGTIEWDGEYGQVDLGYVKGDPGGIPSIGFVESEDELYEIDPVTHARIRPIPPEELMKDSQGNPDPRYEGWVVFCKILGSDDNAIIYAYDYLSNPQTQYQAGIIATQAIEPSSIIIISENEPSTLVEGGIWGVVKNITCV